MTRLEKAAGAAFLASLGYLSVIGAFWLYSHSPNLSPRTELHGVMDYE